MKRLILVVGILMLLIGGSIGAMKVLEVGLFAPAETEEDPIVAAPDPPVFIDLDPLFVNIFDGSTVATTVMITVKLQATGIDNVLFVRENLPRIADAFLKDMHSFLPRLLARDESTLDVFVIKKRLKVIADRLYPEAPVDDVLIQSISEI